MRSALLGSLLLLRFSVALAVIDLSRTLCPMSSDSDSDGDNNTASGRSVRQKSGQRVPETMMFLENDADAVTTASPPSSRLASFLLLKQQARAQTTAGSSPLIIMRRPSGSANSTPAQNASGSSSIADQLSARMAARTESSLPMQDGRGKWARDGDAGDKKSYKQMAYEHFVQVEEFTLGRPCLPSCQFDRKCGMNITPAHLVRAHTRMYGTNTTMAERDGRPEYTCERSFQQVKTERRNLVLSSITLDASDTSKRIERFMVAGIGPVCAEYCRAAHGIPVGAWNLLLASARKGELQAAAEWDEGGDLELDDAPITAAAKEETIMRWMYWLILEDQMPNERARSLIHIFTCPCILIHVSQLIRIQRPLCTRSYHLPPGCGLANRARAGVFKRHGVVWYHTTAQSTTLDDVAH